LIKGGKALEVASKVNAVIFDKTGTLTLGVPRVEEVIPFGQRTQADVMLLAGVAEKFSEHPFGKAIFREAQRRGLVIPDPEQFELKLGQGVVAQAEGRTILVGNEALLSGHGVTVARHVSQLVDEKARAGRTASLVAHGGEIAGAIVLSDTLKADVKQTIEGLAALGINRVEIMTGDTLPIAKSIASAVGIGSEYVHATMSPEDKLRRIEQLQAEGYTVAMVGDGINDAPSLAAANLGVAMAA